jgi:signal transduction histidine kinase/ActR/RegA family two-component response regulator
MILTILYYSYISKSIYTELTTGLSNSLKIIDAAQARMINERIGDVESWAAMSIPEVCFEYERPEAMRVFLNRMKSLNADYSYICAYLPSGSFFASSSTKSSDLFHEVELIRNITCLKSCTTTESVGGQKFIVITSAVFNRIREHVGFISAYLNWTVFNKLLSEYQVTNIENINIQRNMIELFCDKNFEIINRTSGAGFGKELKNLNTKETQKLNIVKDDNGTEYAVTCVKMGLEELSQENITHCLVIDKDVASSPLRFLRNRAVVIAALSIPIIIAAAFLIAGSIMKPFREIFDVLSQYERQDKGKELNKKSFLPSMDIKKTKTTIIDLINRVIKSDSIKKEKKAIEAKAEVKSLFLANMSHEIRTPLNTILGYSGLLKNVNSDRKRKEYIDNILSSGRMLLFLVNEILDLSKMERGKISIDNRPTSISSILREVEKSFQSKMEVKGLAFKISSETIFDLILVKSDEKRLIQILFNLIENAYKFTAAGFVNVSVKKINTRGNTFSMAVSVKDSGIGMADTQTIFHEFEQLPCTETVGGSGLGLAIVYRLVKLMGGNIHVASELNKGSKFTVIFPDMEIVDGAYQETSKEHNEHIEFDPSVIIVADDNEKNLQLISDYLEPYKIKLLMAKNGKEAVELQKTTKSDLIIMDLKMPIMDGFEATTFIKKNSDVPIIMLTADITERGKAKKSKIGYDSYLLKPISQKTLINELKQYLPYKCNKMIASGDDDSLENIFSINGADIDYGMLDQIKKIEKQWPKLRRSMIIEDIEKFARNVLTIGTNYNYKPLIYWSKNLVECSGNYNIRKINRIFSQFPEIVKRLEC